MNVKGWVNAKTIIAAVVGAIVWPKVRGKVGV